MLSQYLENNQIKSNLTKEELLKLKELLKEIKEKSLEEQQKFLGARSLECYLWEIKRREKE